MSATNLVVPSAPNNYTAQQNFMLTPSSSQHWGTQLIQNEGLMTNTQDQFGITFTNNKQDKGVAKLQEAKLVFNIEDPDWEFFGNGVEYVSSESNCNYNIDSQLSDDKKQLTINIKQVDVTLEYKQVNDAPLDQVIEVQPSETDKPLSINFRYTAKQLSTGKFYMSQDPRVVVDRPKED